MPLKTPINLPARASPQAGIAKNARSVVKVRAAGLFATDPVLRKLGKANTFKTGHSWLRWPVLRIRSLLSTRCSAAAVTTAWSRRLRFAKCSIGRRIARMRLIRHREYCGGAFVVLQKSARLQADRSTISSPPMARVTIEGGGLGT